MNARRHDHSGPCAVCAARRGGLAASTDRLLEDLRRRTSSKLSTTVLRLRDGRLIESDPAPEGRLPSHLWLAESRGIALEMIAATGWRIAGELDLGGGGTVGKGSFTWGEYLLARGETTGSAS